MNLPKSLKLPTDSTTKRNMKQYIQLIFFILLSVTAASAAILFSSQSGEISGGLSLGLTQKLLGWIYPNYTLKTLYSWNSFLRNGAHFGIYFLLGFGLSGALRFQKRLPPYLSAFILGVLFAVTDELHQLFSPGRAAQFTDVLLDACGVAVGSLVIYLLQKLCRNHK